MAAMTRIRFRISFFPSLQSLSRNPPIASTGLYSLYLLQTAPITLLSLAPASPRRGAFMTAGFPPFLSFVSKTSPFSPGFVLRDSARHRPLYPYVQAFDRASMSLYIDP